MKHGVYRASKEQVLFSTETKASEVKKKTEVKKDEMESNQDKN